MNAVIPLGYPTGSYDVRVTTTGGENATSTQTFVKSSTGALGTYEAGSGQPFTTIQSAVNQLVVDRGGTAFVATQTINVHAGTYNEMVTVVGLNPTATYRLVIQANTGDTSIIDAQNTRTHCLSIQNNFVVVDGLQLKNPTSYAVQLAQNYGYLVVQNVTATDFGSSGIYIRSPNGTAGAFITVKGCYFEKTSGSGYGTNVDYTTNGVLTVQNNTFVNARAAHTSCHNSIFEGNIVKGFLSNSTVINLFTPIKSIIPNGKS